MKVAFLTSHFPHVIQSFVLNQITGLIDEGVDVHIYGTVPQYTGLRSIIRETISGNSIIDSNHDTVVSEYRLLERATWPVTLPANPKLRPFWDAYLVARNAFLHPTATAQSVRHLEYTGYPQNLGRPQSSLFYSMGPFLRDKEHTYDVIHCHFGPNGLRALLLQDLDLLSGPVVTTFHGYDVHRYPKVTDPSIYDSLFEEGALFTGGSNYVLEALQSLGCPPDRCRKHPMGVSLEFFSPTSREETSPDRPVRILTVARLSEEKGLQYGLQAIRRVADTHPNIEYHIVGHGPLRAELEARCQDLDLERSVYFHGLKSQPEVRDWYQKADIFLLPSITGSQGERETQALVLQEAQAMKLPVVATDIGGIPEGLRPGHSGYVVPEQNAEALADRLQYLIRHPEERRGMGQEGRRFVRRRYDRHHLTKELISIYRSLSS